MARYGSMMKVGLRQNGSVLFVTETKMRHCMFAAQL